jgi:hypothetical protein
MNCTRTAFNLSGSPVFPRKITIRSFTRLLIAYANAYSSSLVVRSVRTQSRVAQLALRNRPYIFIQFSVLFWVMATSQKLLLPRYVSSRAWLRLRGVFHRDKFWRPTDSLRGPEQQAMISISQRPAAPPCRPRRYIRPSCLFISLSSRKCHVLVSPTILLARYNMEQTSFTTLLRLHL